MLHLTDGAARRGYWDAIREGEARIVSAHDLRSSHRFSDSVLWLWTRSMTIRTSNPRVSCITGATSPLCWLGSTNAH